MTLSLAAFLRDLATREPAVVGSGVKLCWLVIPGLHRGSAKPTCASTIGVSFRSVDPLALSHRGQHDRGHAARSHSALDVRSVLSDKGSRCLPGAGKPGPLAKGGGRQFRRQFPAPVCPAEGSPPCAQATER